MFGFEIMPAPFVVAHLQVGLTMRDLDAPLADDGSERTGVFLTNALTGWEPRTTKPLPFPELEEEHDRAERVKQETPILVILGNPPTTASRVSRWTRSGSFLVMRARGIDEAFAFDRHFASAGLRLYEP